MKALLAICCLVLLIATAVSANADIRAPKPPDKPAKVVLSTTLEIAPGGRVYDEARLQITESELKSLTAALQGGASNPALGASIKQSPTRTIVAGLLMFLSISIAGILFARSSSFGRTQKAVAAMILIVAVLGAAAIITRGNAGPPPAYRWRNLPQALKEGRSMAGSILVEVIPDDPNGSTKMRLIIPLQKKDSGEE